MLKDIVELSFAPIMSVEMVAYLRMQIQTHHQLFIQLFPNCNMKLKHHFTYITHYPELIMKFGPLIQFWCMRFEAKQLSLKGRHISQKSLAVALKLKDSCFGIIKHIWIVASKMYLECDLQSSLFNYHLRCYELSSLSRKKI